MESVYKTPILLCWYTLLCIQSGTGLFMSTDGVINPSGDLYLTSYNAFELNCTLTSAYEGSGNASDMEFRIYGKMNTYPDYVFPKDWQVPLAEDSIRLRVPQENATSEASGYYNCMMNDKSIAVSSVIIGDFKSAQPAQSNKASVAEDAPKRAMFFGGNSDYSEPDQGYDDMAGEDSDNVPKPVQNLTCVSPNLEYMDCTFCPEVADATDYTLSWVIEMLPDKSGNCNNSCNPRFNDSPNCYFSFGLTYSITVTASHFYGEVNSTFEITADGSIVKADAVKNLHASSQSSSTLLVTWDHPMSVYVAEFAKLQYYVTYKDNKNGEMLVRSTGMTNSVILDGLTPHTYYTISVKSKPDNQGYWSDESETNGTTQEDAPSVGPGLNPGAFRIACSNSTTDYNLVYVYWEAVPEPDENGVILGYKINCTGLDTGDMVFANMAASDRYFEFERVVTQPFEVLVMAYTSAGNSPPSKLIVPSYPAPSPRSIDAEFITPDTIELRWQPPSGVDEQLVSYSLYMCQGHWEDIYKCQAPTQIIELPANHTSTNLTNQNGEQVHAIAANYEALGTSSDLTPYEALGTSSGLTPVPEWICVYQFSGKPPVPIINNYMVDETTLNITWNSVTCRDNVLSVRILSYRITVDDLESSSGSDKLSMTKEVPSNTTWIEVPGVVPGNRYSVEMWAISKDHQTSGRAEKTIKIDGPIFPNWAVVLIILAFLIVGCILAFVLARLKHRHCASVEIEIPEKQAEDLLPDTGDQMDSGDPVYLIEMKAPEKTEHSSDNDSNSSGYDSLKAHAQSQVDRGNPMTSRQTSHSDSDMSNSDPIEPYPRIGLQNRLPDIQDILFDSPNASSDVPNASSDVPDISSDGSNVSSGVPVVSSDVPVLSSDVPVHSSIVPTVNFEPNPNSAQSDVHPYNTATGSKSCDSYLGTGNPQHKGPQFDAINDGPPVDPKYEIGEDSGNEDTSIWKGEQDKVDRKEAPPEEPVLPALGLPSSPEQTPQHTDSAEDNTITVGSHNPPPLSTNRVMLELDGQTVEVEPSRSLVEHGNTHVLPSVRSSTPAADSESAYVESRHSEQVSDSDDSSPMHSGFSTDVYK